MDFKETGSYFKVQTANEWIEESKLKPMPKKLFSELWYEGEVCILFADTNVGKSILAVQIADSISKGIPIDGFTLETTAQTVLYFDLELNTKQFEIRYSDENGTMHHVWSDKFKRVEINSDFCSDYEVTEDMIIKQIDELIDRHQVRVMIFDNISWMNTDNEKAREAGGLMRRLKQLKTKHEISILVLAHTPKREKYRPITINDLAGSKMISNFADSIFSIGSDSTDTSLRYIKQLKQRNTENLYGEDNVILCKIDKVLNYLCFVFQGHGSEFEHIKQPTGQDDDGLKDEVLRLNGMGKSLREIGTELNINHMRVDRILKKYKEL